MIAIVDVAPPAYVREVADEFVEWEFELSHGEWYVRPAADALDPGRSP